MIIFKFKGKEYTFSGFSAEATMEDGILYLNGDMNDYQFALEVPAHQKRTYNKEDEGVSVSFDFPSGESYSAYFDDGMELPSIEISIMENSLNAVGTFKGQLVGEEPDQAFEIEGNFSIQIQE